MRKTVIAVVLALVFQQAASQSSDKNNNSSSGTIAKKGSFGRYEFAMTTLQGKEIRLTNYAGKVVLVNIWAPWCGPCRLETPGFVNLYEQYKSKGFEIISVAVQAHEEDVRQFVRRYGIQWPVGIKDEVAHAYGTNGIPDNYLFGRNGSLIKHFVGLTTEEELKPAIEDALRPQ